MKIASSGTFENSLNKQKYQVTGNGRALGTANDAYFDVPDPVVPLPAAPPAGGAMPVPAPVVPVVPLVPDVPSAPVAGPLLHPPSINTSAVAESITRALVEDILMINPFKMG